MKKQKALKLVQENNMSIIRVGFLDEQNPITYQQMVEEIGKKRIEVKMNKSVIAAISLNRSIKFLLF